MSLVLSRNEVVVKVFNNNIVLINSDKKEKILFAKGIGFGKKTGDVIEKGTSIDKIFTIENKDNISDFKSLIKSIDKEFFAMCEEAIYEISRKLDTQLNERIHIALIEHLFFAVKRLKNNEEIENPFLIETETLYQKEFTLAKIISKRVEKFLNMRIPNGEIGFIALHIHTALNEGKISNTMKNTYLSSNILNYVENRLGREIDKRSIDYARFCTHVKFALQRIADNKLTNNDLKHIIKNTYKESYSIAQGIAKIIEEELNLVVNEDEISFLAIHIERFRANVK